ncbi:hypothetical protein ACINK0_06150 [Deinococcus sp. VB343]|uniref:hypothetical protein n=1 Tax=Deinococcus sp. VB343 TaxID=3385567 RepID=UPI0039C9AB90
MNQSASSRPALALPFGPLLLLGGVGMGLLLTAGRTLQLMGEMWPLTADLPGQVHREEVPATLLDTVNLHLGTQGVTTLLGLLGGGLALSLAFTLHRRAAGHRLTRWPVTVFSWGLRLLTVALPIVVGAARLSGRASPLSTDSFGILSLVMPLLLLVPLACLTWFTLGRLGGWLALTDRFEQTPDNNRHLQQAFHRVSHPLLGSAVVTALPLLVLLPVMVIDRAPSISIQLPIQRLLVSQQEAMLVLTLLTSLFGTAGLLVMRRLLGHLTHVLDPQHSRMSALWKTTT